MSNVWFTSDLHIGHRLVAATRYYVDDVPLFKNGVPIPEWFGDAEVRAHDRILAEKWDRTVRDDDVVYVLGDICSGTDKAYVGALQWIKERPGRKILIHGNHDPAHGMNRDASKWAVPTREAFVDDRPYLRRRVSLVEGGHVGILLCHFPYEDKAIGIGRDGRYSQYRLPNEGVPVVHGHTHSKEKVSRCTIPTWDGESGISQTLQLHVGVDAWEGTPVPLSWIVSEVQEWSGAGTPQERERGTQP